MKSEKKRRLEAAGFKVGSVDEFLNPNSAVESHAMWLARTRKMPAAKRISAIESRLRTLPKTPTTANVFFRKELLRLRDRSRLEAKLVTPEQLQRENSPFAEVNFKTARIVFRPRLSSR